jgi:Reverse transcriptase (RNA-dependent DNA polymerase)
MPQGTWLGPFLFLVLINDLETSVATFKFVDDVTVTKVTESASSQMQAAAHKVARWSDANRMNIIIMKTKEMLVGRIAILPLPLITFHLPPQYPFTASYRLLGTTVTDTTVTNYLS